MVAAGRARQAGARLAPSAKQAARAARVGYHERLAPRLEQARRAAGPAGRSARERSAVAVAVLRGELSPREVRGAISRRRRRERALRMARRLGVAGLVAGGAFAAWRWWGRQSNPDWLMEPTPATEVSPGDLDAEAIEEAEASEAADEAEEAAARREAG